MFTEGSLTIRADEGFLPVWILLCLIRSDPLTETLLIARVVIQCFIYFSRSYRINFVSGTNIPGDISPYGCRDVHEVGVGLGFRVLDCGT